MRKHLAVLVTLVIATPVCYLALMYGSLASARFSVSSIGLAEVPDPIDALLSKKLDLDMYLDVDRSIVDYVAGHAK